VINENYKRENEWCILSMGYAVFLFINKGIKKSPVPREYRTRDFRDIIKRV